MGKTAVISGTSGQAVVVSISIGVSSGGEKYYLRISRGLQRGAESERSPGLQTFSGAFCSLVSSRSRPLLVGNKRVSPTLFLPLTDSASKVYLPLTGNSFSPWTSSLKTKSQTKRRAHCF